MPFLIVRSGPRAGERIELVGELVVGRENADVTVSDEEVSRRHLAVRPHEDGVELEDLGSTNGTFVDGARLSAVVVVSSTARVVLGDTELEIEVEEPEPEFDPSATRLRERPPERDATVVRPLRCRGAQPAARRDDRRRPARRRPPLRAPRPRPWPPLPPPVAAVDARPVRHVHAGGPGAPAHRRRHAPVGPGDDRLPRDRRDGGRADHLLRRAVARRSAGAQLRTSPR